LNGIYKLLLDLTNDTMLKKNHDKKFLKLYNCINPFYSKDFFLGKAEYCIPKVDLPPNISVKDLFYNVS